MIRALGHRLWGLAVPTARALLSPVALGVSVYGQDEQGRVLLVRHSYMMGWHLPGGGVNRNEPPEHAALREMQEEVGLVSHDPVEFVGLFTRPAGLATNVIALYRLQNIKIDFRPNWEIREICFADPAAPPPGITRGTARRLAEFVSGASPSPYW